MTSDSAPKDEMCVCSLQTLANVPVQILEVDTSGGWRWLVGIGIDPIADFMLWNLPMDVLGGTKAIHCGKGH